MLLTWLPFILENCPLEEGFNAFIPFSALHLDVYRLNLGW